MASFRKGFKEWAETIALNFREKLDIKFSDFLPARGLAAYLNVRVLEPADIPLMSQDILNSISNSNKYWSAITIKCNDVFYVIHNSNHTLPRQESNIMHELSHIICEHEMSELDNFNNIPLRKYKEKDENEAEWLGACLQLPKRTLLYNKSFLSLDEMREKFTVSEEMLRYRMNVTGCNRKFANKR